MTKEEIFQQLCDVLVKDFEVDREQITPEAHLYRDLDIDSIDAVDLLVHLRNIIGKRVPPEVFREVRTVEDVTSAIAAL